MRCKYIRKIFQNEENGYTVALFSTLDHEVPLSARDKFWADKKIIAFTAKGYDLPLTDEIEIEMEGEWETNSHGTQYKVETFLEVVPRTREGILGYLSCGSLKGIGPKTAERIVNRFGLDTLEVMEKYPQELLKIQGISQKKLDRIVDSFGKNKVFRELMTFLSPFHVTPKKANMILQKFRDQSVEIIRKQPYILCSVKGFGFLTVDAIARQCCAATNDPMRISGCVSYVLREAMKQNGHLYLEQEILVKDALKVLNKEPDLQPVTETEILKVLYRLVMQDSIVVEENHASNLTAVNSNHSAFEKYVDKNRKSYTIAGNSFGSSVYTTALNTSTGDLMYSAAKYAKGLAAEAQKESSYDSAGRKSVQHAIQTVTQYMYKFGKEVGIYK